MNDSPYPEGQPGRWDADGRLLPPEHIPPQDGETRQEARRRRNKNRFDRQAWDWFMSIRCDRCGQVRGHVNHEPNPDTSIEGPDYYADFLHELHAFVEPHR